MPNNDLKIYDWVYFAQSYVYSARLLCDQMTQNPQDITKIFIPTMYLLKHGIETFIKLVFIILNDELGDGHRIHDSRKLIKKMGDLIAPNITVIKVKLKQNLSAEQLSSSPDAGKIVDLKTAISSIPTLSADLNLLTQLVLKYYHCDIVRDKIVITSIEDTQNDFFRFPDNAIKVWVDYDSVLDALSVDDIRQIEADAVKLYDTFNNLGFLLSVYKHTSS